MASLPYLGVGLSYRWELNALITRNQAGIDWLEITPEHFMPLNEDTKGRLALLGRKFPLAGHSLELSVGSDDGSDEGYRQDIRRFLGVIGAPWHGDHLCFTRAGAAPVHALSALPFTEEAVETAARNIRRIQGELGVPFLIENITYYLPNPLSEMDEAEFIRRVVLASGAGLVLDLHNVLANAHNHGHDPYRFLDRLPLDHVVQIHIAGGERAEGLLLDTHTACSPDDVWRLLEYVVPRCPVRAVNFEMDSGFPPFERIVEELGRARDILARHGASKA